MFITEVSLIILLGCLLLTLYEKYRAKLRRIAMIDTFVFPSGIATSLGKTYPHLSLNQINLTLEQMREYFHLCNISMGESGTKVHQVGMPSKVVDEAWHEFILFTKQYEAFCKQAFGTFLHHTPATAMASEKEASDFLRNTWRIACHRQNINPKEPSALPPIFAIDTLLGISDGFAYSLNGDGPAFDARQIACNGGKGASIGTCHSFNGGCSGGCGGN